MEKITMAVEVIVDNSGSMSAIRGRVVKGLNEFAEQLASAFTPVNLTMTLFDDCLRRSLIDNVPVYEAPRIKPDDYMPNWGTENIAFSAIQALDKLAKVDAYQKVLVIVTDGLNASRDIDRARKLVQKRMSEGWLVMWLGTVADMGSRESTNLYKKIMAKYAKNMGIPEGLTFCFGNNDFDKVMPLAAMAALRFSGTGDQHDAEFTPAERGVA